MSKRKISFSERAALHYLSRRKRKTYQFTDDWHILNETEQAVLKQTYRLLLFWTSLTGAMGVLIYYVPVDLYPEYFPKTPVQFWGNTYEIPIISNLYSIILSVLEIFVLYSLHLNAVHKMAEVCNYPDKNDLKYEEHILALAEVSLEKKDKRVLKLGLNPMQGVPKIWIFAQTLFNLVRAFLSNFLAKLLFRRLLGRVLLRVWLDLMGMPIYAFWNMFAANLVFHEAKIRILAPRLIAQMTENMQVKFQENILFQEHLYDVLQAMTMKSRRFHYAHYLFAASMLQAFQIPIKKQHLLEKDIMLTLKALPNDIVEAYCHIFCFGFILDGRIGQQEKKWIQELYEAKLSPISPEKLSQWAEDYWEGRGIDELVNG
ncbi:MAG: LBF_2804 family protein [Bacteroidia bacterium]